MKRIVSLSVFAISFMAAAVTVFVSPQEKAPANGAAAVFEKSFANGRAVRRATWAVTAQGVFEAFANGRRVGNDFLKPGVTECGKCRHVYSYDVTDLLDRRAGATNVLSATVTPGWWCDQMMRPPAKVSDWQRGNKREWQLGEEIAFRGELRLEFDDGSAQTVGTDESWLAAYTGPLVSAGIYEGEVYDARRRVEGLKGVRRNTEFAGELRPAAAKIALREDLVLTPREMHVVKGVEGASKDAFGVAKVIRRYADGEDVRLEPGEMLVIDFGQNCSAVPSFEVTGEAGAELKIRASEMLNESHGEKSRGNDGPAGTPYLAALRSAYAGIHYTLKDGRQAYMPRYTYFGYRYLGVTATRPVVFTRWRSTPVSSVTREMERGRIVTGNARVNRLIANIRWGLLSNYLSSPTDCPQRDERMGWTADTQVFMNSAAYFADTSEFLGKYLADLRDAQRASGCYMCFVPNVRHTFPPWASAGWTDAGVIIPYRLWKWYGDRRFIDASWESMVRYMDFLEGNTEPYRINHGDWLAFEHHKKNAGDAMDGRQVKALNAYFRVWMAMLMREMAAATGRGEAERHYAEEEAKLRQAFTAAYVGPDGTIKDEYKGQCNDLYMLKLGLCGGAAAVEATKRDLIDNIKACGNRLQTGFLGTAILMPTLTFEANAPELAYSLLLQDAFPSWLYSVDQGATTVWERWNGYTKEKGFGPVGMNSFNHYAYGCVAEWLFAAAAGIRQPKGAVGWKHFVLAPIPDKRLGSVDASFISPEGVIKSSWKYGDDGTWTWTFTVPKGTSATVSAPGIPEREYGPGEWTVTTPPPLAETTPVSCIGMKRSWDPYPGWWEKRHAEKLAQIASSGGKIDIVFIGDSITHNWEGARGPGSDHGGKPLAELKKKYSVLNLGFGGDGTQNVLWRLLNGELDGYTARYIVLMIGTNNGGRPENTAAGIRAILDLIARKQPQAVTILLPIFPSGATADHPWRVRNAKVNALIKPFADGRRVIWCDFNARFLNPDGTLKKELMMPDNLHPAPPAYEIWAEEVTPLFKKICDGRMSP